MHRVLAEDDRALAPQRRDHGRIPRRPAVPQGGRARRRRIVDNIDVVLHADRHAMQQVQPFALPAGKIGRPRRFQNLVGIARDEGIQMLVRFRALQET